MSKVILIVGAKKRGKTTSAKKAVAEILKKDPRLTLRVFDKNGDWGAPGPLPSMERFLSVAARERNQIAVFEDAGIFFSNRGRSEALDNILTGARHTNTVVLLLFHSLRALPEYVVEQSDIMILHKTKDNPATVQRKFGDWPEIFEAWQRVQADAWIHSSEDVPIE